MRARFGLKLQVVTGCKGCERKSVHLCECLVRGGEWGGCCPKSSVKIGTAVDEIKLSATPQQLLQWKLFVAVKKNTARGAERSHSSCCELVVCRLRARSAHENTWNKFFGMVGTFWDFGERPRAGLNATQWQQIISMAACAVALLTGKQRI